MTQPQPYSPELPASDCRSQTADDVTVQLYEETAQVGRREVLQGRVEVRTTTELHEQIVHEVLSHVDVVVTRVPVGRTLMDGNPVPQVRTEGDLTIVPVLEEVLVIEKRLVLKEELHLHRTTKSEVAEVPVTLRRQSADIQHIALEAGTGMDDSKPHT